MYCIMWIRRCFVLMVILLICTSQGDGETQISGSMEPTTVAQLITTERQTGPSDPNCSEVHDFQITSTSIQFKIPLSEKTLEYKAVVNTEHTNTSQITDENEMTFLFKDLPSGTQFNITLTAVGYNNLSSLSSCSIVNYTRPSDPNCSEVHDFQITSTSIQFKILLSEKTLEYKAVVNTEHTNTSQITNGDEITFLFQDLSSGTQFNITLTAFGYNNLPSLSSCSFVKYTLIKNRICYKNKLISAVSEKQLTVDLSAVSHQESQAADAYKVTYNSKTSIVRLPYIENTYNITDLEPATDYIVDVRLAKIDENEIILTSSEDGCITHHFTRPLLHCNQLNWSNQDKSYLASVTNEMAPNAKAFKCIIQTSENETQMMFPKSMDDPIDVVNISLKSGLTYNVTLYAEGGGNMSSKPCTEILELPAKILRCDSSVVEVTENRIFIDMSNVTSNGAEKYHVTVTDTSSDQTPLSSDFKKEGIVLASNLRPGTQYKVILAAFGENGVESTPCSFKHYTKPARPVCNAITVTSSNQSIILNISGLVTRDTVAHIVNMINVSNKYPSHTFAQLTPGICYDFNVTSVGPDGQESDGHCNVSAYTRPNDLFCDKMIIRNQSVSSIYLDWGNFTTEGAISYNIKREPGDSFIWHNTETSYMDNNLTPGTSYAFTIDAVGKNNLTSSKSCNVSGYTVPAKPGNLISLDKRDDGFVIIWGNSDGHVQRYEVDINCQCRQDFDACKPSIVNGDSITDSTANITGLVPGTHCNLTIMAIVPNLKSEIRNLLDTKIESKEEPPGRVQNVTIDGSNISSQKFKVTWSPPLRPNGDVTTYTVNISEINGNEIESLRTANLSEELKGLSAGMCYVVNITASNSAGDGETTSVIVYTTESKPEQVSNLTVISYTPNSLNVTWQEPKIPNGVIRSYQILVKDADETHCVKVINMNCTDCTSSCLNATTNTEIKKYSGSEIPECGYAEYFFSSGNDEEFSVIVHDLKPYTTYTVTVSASTLVGVGLMSSARKRTMEDRPSNVTNLRAVSADENSITIEFKQPDPPNGKLLYYTIEYEFINHSDAYCLNQHVKVAKTVNVTNFDVKEEIINHKIDNLFPYWNYDIKVQATDKAGSSNWTDMIHNRTSTTAPGQVRSIKVITTLASSIYISWIEPCFPNGIIDMYQLNIYSNGAFNRTVQTNGTFINVTELYPFTNYMVKIKGHTFLGQFGNYAEHRGVIKTLTDIPLPPDDVVVHVSNSSSITVNWNPPVRKTGPTNYIVFAVDAETQDNSSVCKTYGFDNTNCVITDLDEYWNYTIHVMAFTINGSRVASNIPSVQTLQDAPGKIQKLKVSVEEDVTKPRQVNISWVQPTKRDLNGMIRYYYVEYYADNNKKVTIKVSGKTFGINDIQVEAGSNYTFQVYAETNKNGTRFIHSSVMIPMGAPPPVPKHLIQSGPTDDISNAEKQLAVFFNTEYLCNSSNGKPNNWGIIVSEESETGNTVPYRGSATNYELEKKKRYQTWFQVHDSDKMKPYIASNKFNPKCPSGRRKRDTETSKSTVSFIIGSEKECGQEKFCNGYLKPGKNYRIRTWSCTVGGCVESEYSSPLSTEPNMVPIIAGAVSSSVVVFAVVIIIIILLLRRKRRGQKENEQTDTGQSNAGFHQVEESLEMKSRSKPKPVRLADFTDHVNRMHGDNNLMFQKEYELVKDLSPRHPTTAAEAQNSRLKNRYTNILAFDHSRVKLLPVDDDEDTDYINANYIPGYNSKREFIATQGPTPCTIDDFWRMLWEQKISIIVMLTQLVERGRRKCEMYWPEKPHEPVFHANIVVELTSESTLPNYMLREFTLSIGDVTRKIKHFQYLDWPDMGTPDTTDSMIGFVRSVRSHLPAANTEPIVVHCSAGVGRTGTFIAIDYLIHHVVHHITINIFDLVMTLRHNRTNMVQTEDQYVFIHDCMNDYINDDDDEEEEPVYANT